MAAGHWRWPVRHWCSWFWLSLCLVLTAEAYDVPFDTTGGRCLHNNTAVPDIIRVQMIRDKFAAGCGEGPMRTSTVGARKI